MAKQQTRRSISLNRKLYDLAIKHAESVGRPLSQMCEDALIVKMDEDGVMGLGDLVAELTRSREANKNLVIAMAKRKTRSASKRAA